MSVASAKESLILGLGKLVCLSLPVLLCGFPAWSQQFPLDQTANSAVADSQGTQPSAGGQQHPGHQTGSISGKVVDQSGANIVGAVVKLTREGHSSNLDVTSDEDGLFAFSNVAPGPFQLTISSPGLASQDFSGTLQSGEAFVTPLIMLVIPTQVTEVHVGLPPEELAEVQIKEEEKQRVLGVIPNFYVSYEPNAAPLAAKQKFELAWKSASDPATLVGVGVLAGIDQAGDRWGAYGQGAQGYGKRYGAVYADVFAATFIGGAVMPSILKQDPRYFYKGTGSKRSRFLYAVASSFICKGDNGHWQPNYSNVIGSFAGAGLEALYIPANDRRGSGFVVSGALVRLGETSLAGVLQEFVFSKLSKRPRRSASQP
ncbi:MAG: carboxypeptidase-like regulatory domain-containing protein [Candidatus Acidiferrum sp.]|jgi:carboxypeptidase family protein